MFPSHDRWGVFATEDIYENEIIEECYFIPISIEKDIGNLMDYRFDYVLNGKRELGILNGQALVYNHSDNNNAAWRNHKKYKALVFYAVRDIKKGEEIFTYYGGEDYWKERPNTKII